MKPLTLFIFALACERVVVRMKSIESRCVTGPGNILFVGASGNFKVCGREGVNLTFSLANPQRHETLNRLHYEQSNFLLCEYCMARNF